jgi:hypothetical protein
MSITEKELFSRNTEHFLKSMRSNMMNDTFGIRYCALSGLAEVSFTLTTGLRPGFTNSTLSGLMKISTCNLG